jgi:hypothetical protein
VRLFISGHSLTDQPFPDHLAAIGQSLGTPLDWRRQYLEGSSILARSADLDTVARDFEGCDALVITEQHGVLGGLIWNDTVRCLRTYHDRFIAANPRGVTYFYEPWLGVSDLDDPRRWIAYERAAAPIWRGIVTRVNLSLEAEGRSDRIVPLPAASALAALVERATSPQGVIGLSGASTRETLRRLFADDVHLTGLGSYFMALVTYVAVLGRSPIGAEAPNGVPIDRSRALQQFASEFMAADHDRNAPWPMERVRRYLLQEFNGLYWAYVRDVYFRRDRGIVASALKASRHRVEWHLRFSRRDASNPLV